MAATTSGDTRARAAGSFVGEYEISMEVVPKGLNMDLSSMRVNASEAFWQSVATVCAAFEVLRSFAQLRALEMRSSLSALSSRERVA